MTRLSEEQFTALCDYIDVVALRHIYGDGWTAQPIQESHKILHDLLVGAPDPEPKPRTLEEVLLERGFRRLGEDSYNLFDPDRERYAARVVYENSREAWSVYTHTNPLGWTRLPHGLTGQELIDKVLEALEK